MLRGAALRLLRLPGVTVPTRQALQRLAALLGEAGPCTPQDLRTPTAFTRLDEHCRPAEHLARMVLGNQTLRCAAGTAGAAVFLIDMNTAFETFVAARLARYLAGRLTVRTQQTQPLGHGGTARIRPDLTFEQPGGTTVYVADTKYKITADGYATRPRLLPDPRLHQGPRRTRRHADLLPARRRRPAHSHHCRRAPVRLDTWALLSPAHPRT